MKKTIESPLIPLTGQYARLRDDLELSLAAGRAAEDAAPRDNSFWNWNCFSIVLPHWNSERVAQAAKEAGTFCARCSRTSFKWVFLPNSRKRGAPSVLNTETVAVSLRSMGYKAAVYDLK